MSLPSSSPSNRFKSTSTGSPACVCCIRLSAPLPAAKGWRPPGRSRAPSRFVRREVGLCVPRRMTPRPRHDEHLGPGRLRSRAVMLGVYYWEEEASSGSSVQVSSCWRRDLAAGNLAVRSGLRDNEAFLSDFLCCCVKGEFFTPWHQSPFHSARLRVKHVVIEKLLLLPSSAVSHEPSFSSRHLNVINTSCFTRTVSSTVPQRYSTASLTSSY